MPTREEAFDRAYREIERRVRATVASYVRKGSTDDRDDVLQMVRVRLWQAFDPDRPLGPLIPKAALWASVEYRRAERPAEPLDDAMPDRHGDFSGQIAHEDALGQAVATLTWKQRRALGMQLDGQSPEAIAKACGCASPGAANTLVHDARQRVMSRLAEKP